MPLNVPIARLRIPAAALYTGGNLRFRDVALKAFVDQWLHIALEDGSVRKIHAAGFE
jgi:hypothetical protein